MMSNEEKEILKPFNAGDKVIWNSGFGYEIGTFVEEKNMYGCFTILLCSGSFRDTKIQIYTGEVQHYSKELIEELTK